MDLRLSLKAVQSLQSFSDEFEDEVVLFGEVLGVPVSITSPSPILLQKLDELLAGVAAHNQTQAQTYTQTQTQTRPYDNVDYQMGAEYNVGELGDD